MARSPTGDKGTSARDATRCPVCGAENPPDVAFCYACWTRLAKQPSRELVRRGRPRAWLAWGLLWGALLAGVLWVIGEVVGFPWVGSPPPASQVEARAGPGTWPSLGGGPGHLHALEGYEGTYEGKVVWKFATQGPLVASPVVADGRVFLATGERRVIALSADTGTPLWEVLVTGPVDATPAVAGDLLYVGLRDKRLLALDVRTGAEVWAFWTDGPIFSAPVVRGGVVYVGSGDGHLYALDASTGRKRWAFRVGGWVIMSPAVGEGVAVVAGGRSIFVVDLRQGRARLRYDTVSPPTGVIALQGPLAFVASEDGAIRAIDTRQREIPGERFARWWRIQLFIWRMMGEPPPQKGFVWAKRFSKGSLGNGVAVAGDTLYLATKGGTLYALDTHTGAERWRAQIGEGIGAAPVIVGGSLYVGTERGQVLAIDPKSGEKKTVLSLGEEGIIALVPTGPHLYVATQRGAVYSVR